MESRPAFRVAHINPRVRRIWHSPDGAFERLPDPAVSDSAREVIAAAGYTMAHEFTDAARLTAADGSNITPLRCEVDADGRISIAFELAPDERIYGAFDADHDSLDRRGTHVHVTSDHHNLGQHTVDVLGECDECPHEPQVDMGFGKYGELPVPLVISNRGYAVYVSNHATHARFDFGTRVENEWSYTAAGGHADIYLIGPCSIADCVREYTWLTGDAPLPPVWALGYLQSRFGYESFEHAHSVLERCAAESLPVHGIILDVQWIESMVNLRWHHDFPDPESNLAAIHARGVRTVVITEPGTRHDSGLWAEPGSTPPIATDAGAEARPIPPVPADMWATNADGSPFAAWQWYSLKGIIGFRDDEFDDCAGAVVNVYNDEACDWWYARHEHLLDQGVDAWWLDLNEPEGLDDSFCFPNATWPATSEQLPGTQWRNTYSLAQQRLFAERDLARGRRPFLLSRSGTAGGQRYGTAPWSGDIKASWDDMRRQSTLALNAGLVGYPLYGCDIGGFFNDPSPELFARWMQLGAFLPIFRAHGMMTDREPWSFGDEALAAIKPAMTMRGQLLPSIATWARDAIRARQPLVRPHVLDWPEDERFANCSDQWCFGPLLVAPVVEEGATQRTVLLPPGEWVNPFDGEIHAGGGAVDVAVELDTIPLFVAAGSVLVVDPAPLDRRGTNWPPAALEVWAFPGSSGIAEGHIYIDDGISRAHEHGAWADVHVQVDGDALRITHDREGYAVPAFTLGTPHLGSLSALAHAGA